MFQLMLSPGLTIEVAHPRGMPCPLESTSILLGDLLHVSSRIPRNPQKRLRRGHALSFPMPKNMLLARSASSNPSKSKRFRDLCLLLGGCIPMFHASRWYITSPEHLCPDMICHVDPPSCSEAAESNETM